ncbi:MAG: UDP-N-acetylmuramoyl-tripeptide--D-alanyl-D-alanine ligase [Pseudomonadota bacterium]
MNILSAQFLSLSGIAKNLNVELLGEDKNFNNISIDSRSLTKGDLYIAISGDRFDGHDFIAEAMAKGAIGCVVEQSQKDNRALSQLVVKDSKLALGQIASIWAEKWKQQNTEARKVIAITGSCGKTTLKEMICSIAIQKFKAKDAVLSTIGNLNNEFGVPLTLMRLNSKHQLAIIEMGANHLQEIAYLSGLVKADIAIITNAGSAHVEGFGSLEAVAKGKGEIFSTLPEQSIAIINNDDIYANYWKSLIDKSNHKIVSFAIKNKADISAEQQTSSIEDDLYLWQVTTDEGVFSIKLPSPGKHNLANALAAIATGQLIGASITQIQQGLQQFENVSGRLEVSKKQQRFTLINDSYNANPESVKAAIDVLAAYPNKEKILVLGDMGELGKQQQQLHQQVGEYAANSQIKNLYTLGELSKHTLKGFQSSSKSTLAKSFDSISELNEYLTKIDLNDSVVLIKGSRNMAMEEVVVALEDMN